MWPGLAWEARLGFEADKGGASITLFGNYNRADPFWGFMLEAAFRR